MLYKVVCFYQDPNKPNRAVPGLTGLYLEQAQEICKDRETSSRTCTKAAGKARTRKYGPWFYGYTEDK